MKQPLYASHNKPFWFVLCPPIPLVSCVRKNKRTRREKTTTFQSKIVFIFPLESDKCQKHFDWTARMVCRPERERVSGRLSDVCNNRRRAVSFIHAKGETHKTCNIYTQPIEKLSQIKDVFAEHYTIMGCGLQEGTKETRGKKSTSCMKGKMFEATKKKCPIGHGGWIRPFFTSLFYQPNIDMFSHCAWGGLLNCLSPTGVEHK